MQSPSSLSQELNHTNQNKHSTVQFRIAAVRALRYYTTNEVCAQYKIKPRTLYNWKKTWLEYGSLAPRPIPGRPQKLDDDVKRD